MEKRSKRMQPIQELVELKEKNMARRLAECQRTLSERETRLQELTQYRDSYVEQHMSTETANPVHLQEYQLFIGKLNHAIVEQERLVASGQADLDVMHAQWADSRAKSNAIQKAVERMQKNEQAHLNRTEQKASDEMASLRFPKKTD